MNDWLRLLTNAVKLASGFAEKQAECEYDAGYFLAHDYEELQKAKKDAIESLAEELYSLGFITAKENDDAHSAWTVILARKDRETLGTR